MLEIAGSLNSRTQYCSLEGFVAHCRARFSTCYLTQVQMFLTAELRKKTL